MTEFNQLAFNTNFINNPASFDTGTFQPIDTTLVSQNFSLQQTSLSTLNFQPFLGGNGEFNFTLPQVNFSNLLQQSPLFNLNLNAPFMPIFGSGFSSSSTSCSDSFTRTSTKYRRNYTGTYQEQLAQRAADYIGRVNSDKQGNKLFSHGISQHWCADFVTSVVKDTYGSKIPSSFGSSSVSELQQWGRDNKCYLSAPSLGGNNAEQKRKDFIAQNVKVGDIMIEKNNKSHTGIVSKVASDGSWFKVVEGNSSDKVQEVTYQATSDTLSGFVNLDRYSA